MISNFMGQIHFIPSIQKPLAQMSIPQTQLGKVGLFLEFSVSSLQSVPFTCWNGMLIQARCLAWKAVDNHNIKSKASRQRGMYFNRFSSTSHELYCMIYTFIKNLRGKITSVQIGLLQSVPFKMLEWGVISAQMLCMQGQQASTSSK